MMTPWTASCSIPLGEKRCVHALSAAAFFCELLTLTLILKQTACVVHASDSLLQGLTIHSCMCRSAMTSWTHIRGAHTKAEGGL